MKKGENPKTWLTPKYEHPYVFIEYNKSLRLRLLYGCPSPHRPCRQTGGPGETVALRVSQRKVEMRSGIRARGGRQAPPMVTTGLLVLSWACLQMLLETSASSRLSLGLSCSYQAPSPPPGLGLALPPRPHRLTALIPSNQDRWLLAPLPPPLTPKLHLQITYHRDQSKEKQEGKTGREGELSGRNHSEGDLPHMLRWASQEPGGMGGPQEMNDRQGT